MGIMRRTVTRATVAVLFGSLVLLSAHSPVFAQNQDAAAAEVLFRDGRVAAEAGDTVTACAKFHESQHLDPALGTLLNIADCEEKLGHLATAWTAYEEVAQRLPAEDERRTIAATRSAALEPRLPRLRIHLEPGAPPGTQVERDGIALGTASLDTPLPVDPGKHVVEVTAPGRQPRTFDVSVREGETKTLAVQSGAPVVVLRHRTGTEQPNAGAKTAGYVLMGVGAAAAVAGVVTGMLVLDRKNTVNEHCDADKRCSQAGLDAAESGKTLGILTTAALATGVVGLGAGTVLVLTAGRDSGPAAGFGSAIALRGTF
jgi:hypothetical protein